MRTTAVYLNGHLDVPRDRLADVMAGLEEHLRLTRAEPGCVSFSVEPCPDVAGRLIVAEIFRDQAAFEHHQARTRASPWFELTAGMPRDYTIGSEPP